MHLSRRKFTALAGTLLPSVAALAQQPAAFPARPVRIVPFGTAGGPIELLIRGKALLRARLRA